MSSLVNEKTMRVLHMIGSLNMGGSQMMVKSLYSNMDKNKIQFDFIIDRPTELELASELREMGAEIFVMPMLNGRNIFAVRKAWKTFFEEHPEYKILHSHVRSYASVYFPVAKRYGVKTIIHSHSTSNGSGLKSVVKKILQYPLRNQADCFFACSRSAGEWLYGKKLAKRKKIHIIPNAIDVEKYKVCHETRKTYREQLEINETTQVYIHVGRMHQAKNHGFLLKMF